MSGFPAAMALIAVCIGMAAPTPAFAAPAAKTPGPTNASAPAPTRIASAPTVRSVPALSGATEVESRFVGMINQERTRRGLRPLAWDPTLCDAARLHSEEMARLDYFDHRSPVSGRETPADRWERAVSQVPDEYMIAENLFFGSVADVAWGHRSLMESDGHRRNILNPEYASIGVGVHVDRNGQMWVTQMFTTGIGIRRAAADYTAF